MASLIETALINAVLATGLAILAAAVARLARRPALTHALWVLVLVKFVTAPVIEVPVVVGFDLASLIAQPLEQSVVARGGEGETRRGGERETVRRESAEIGSNSGEQTAKIAASGHPSSSIRDPRSSPPRPLTPSPPHSRLLSRVVCGLLGAWLLGTCLWFLIQADRIRRFVRYLRRAQPANPRLQRRTAQLAYAMGLRRAPEVWMLPDVTSPMLWALGPQTKLLFPAGLAEQQDEDSVATLLAHELAHYRRGDHWIRLLELVVTGLFWWHPVVWWSRREIEQAEEICCDAWVVSHVSTTPRLYAEALLDAVTYMSAARCRRPAVSSGLAYAESIRARLTAIMTQEPCKNLSVVGRTAVAAIALLCLPLHFEPTGRPWSPVLVSSSIGRDRASAREMERGGERERGRPGEGTTSASRNRPLAPSPDLPLVPGARRAAADRSASAVAGATGTREPQNLRDPGALQQEAFRQESEQPWAQATSPAGHAVVTAVTDRSVQFENRQTGRRVDLTPYGITRVAFSPVDRVFVTGGSDGALRFFDADAAQRAVLKGHAGVVRSVAYAPKGRHVASAGDDGLVKLWTIGDRFADAASPRRLPGRYSQPVNCVRFSPDGTQLAVAVGDWREGAAGRVELWDVATRTRRAVFRCAAPVGAITFTPQGERIVAGQWSGTVAAWDVRTGEKTATGHVAKERIPAAAFSPDNEALAGLQMERDADWLTRPAG